MASVEITYISHEKRLDDTVAVWLENNKKIKASAKQAGLGDIAFTLLNFSTEVDSEDKNWFRYDVTVDFDIKNEKEKIAVFLDALTKEEFHPDISISEEEACE